MPLARLLRVQARRDLHHTDGGQVPSDLIVLTLETATEEIQIECYGVDKIPVVRGVVEALPDPLRAIGRKVSRRRRPRGAS